MDDTLTFAQSYAALLGWRVFPIQPGTKVPLAGSHGCRDASSDPGQISQWFGDNPTRNLAIRTGPRDQGGSGLFVVDIDVRHGGEITWEYLSGEFGFPNTVSCVTPSGGRHYYYIQEDGYDIPCSAGRLGPGVDIRAAGGYVLAPPSQIDGNPYAWDISPRHPIAEAPDWLLEKVVRAPDRAELPGIPADGRVPKGRRHDFLLSLAGFLRDRGMGPKVIRAALLAANIEFCDPPEDRRAVLELADDVADRYNPTHGMTEGGKPRRLKLVSAHEVKARPAPDWLVRGVLVQKSIAVMAGEPRSFKTFLALDMALSIANGVRWAERAVHRGPTVYIVAEGAHHFGRRVEAWEQEKELMADEGSGCHFVEEAVNMLDDSEVSLLLIALDDLPERPTLVVIDTLARCFGAESENDTHAMNRFVASIERIKRDTGACVLVLHHLAKNTGSVRGSGALTGAADTVLVVERIKETVRISNSPPRGKQKDAPELPYPIRFTPTPVKLSEGREGLVLRHISLAPVETGNV